MCNRDYSGKKCPIRKRFGFLTSLGWDDENLLIQISLQLQSSPQRRLVFLEGVFSVQNPKLPVDIGWLWSSEENIGGHKYLQQIPRV